MSGFWSELYFANPTWVHLVWPCLLFMALLVWLERRRTGKLARFMEAPMQSRLAIAAMPGRRYGRLALLGVAMVAVVVALMRPQTPGGLEAIETSRTAADIMVLLDVSKSMLAEDAAPSRLERAKADVLDLTSKLKGNRVGLTAFAGRAVVLCPLTPDEAFFRMVAKGVSVHSISRGGTRIGDGIRQAVHAFPNGQASKLILLVTDGEDHDSNPLEAAEAARTAGVRIVAIGFGSEEGSEIFLKDPETGARKVFTDRGGNVVRSRLDGETLRKIALATEGAYVPAGTASLDLESIVKDHISPLVRTALEKSMRRAAVDHYPWFLLIALAALVGAAWLAALPAARTGRFFSQAVAFVILMGALSLAGSASADVPPRRLYNQAREAFAKGDFAGAAKGFLEARDRAESDVDLRFSAAFNLGIALAKQAELGQKDKPEEALGLLRQSAAWLRDAIRLAPAGKPSENARTSLEAVLKRIQILAHTLNQGANSLEARLTRLIEDERGLGGRVGAVWERISASGTRSGNMGDIDAAPRAFREEIQSLEALQRSLLADAAAASDLAADESAQLGTKAEAERSSKEQMRIVMLGNMDHYAEQARSAMADARHLLSRLQVRKAHAKVGEAVDALKRAREQMQDPVTILRGISQEEMELAGQTAGLASFEKGRRKIAPIAKGAESVEQAGEAPAWLTAPFLGQGQTSVRSRLAELVARIKAGLEAADRQAAAPQNAGQPKQAQEQKGLLEMKAAITPLAEADKAMAAATQALAVPDLALAQKQQEEALLRLFAALEQFADIRSLIELAYADQARMVDLLSPTSTPASQKLSTRERTDELGAAAEKNRSRLDRLKRRIEEERTQAQPGPGGQPATPDKDKEKLALLDAAEGERAKAQEAVEAFAQKLGHKASGRELGPLAEKGREHIETLRRLFFSIVEHLKDLLAKQGETHDRTSAAQSITDDDKRRAALAPMSEAEAKHAAMGARLGEALRKQADQANAAGQAQAQAGDSGQDPSAAQAKAMAKPLAAAAEEVAAATSAMNKAGQTLTEGTGANATMSLDVSEVVSNQQAAMGRLAKAIEILSPPEQKPQDQDKNKDEEKQQAGDKQQGEQKQQAQPSPSDEKKKQQGEQQQMSKEQANRRLEEAREREAARQRQKRERQKGAAAPTDPVEKDW